MRALKWAAVFKTIGCILLSWGIIGMVSCGDAMNIAGISGAAIGVGAVLMGFSKLCEEEVKE